MVLEVENFYGVYLLYNVNPQFKGRTYIGYTVNPRRRIGQHNKGVDFGGAKRTSGKGPWEMVLIIYGFPTDISALMFEWAWQHPKKSRRLRHIPGKRSREPKYDYCLRVAANMLRVGPWCRMPLTFHWILQEYRREFPVDAVPPVHMAIGYGPITSIKISTKEGKKKKKKTQKKGEHSSQASTSSSATGGINDSDDDGLISMSQNAPKRCDVCHKRLQAEDFTLTCVQPNCWMESHMICLSKKFLGPDSEYLLPIDGACPKCKQALLWGDLIRKKRGCYSNLEALEDPDEDHWSEQLRETQTTT